MDTGVNQRLKRLFSYRLTFMLVPHDDAKPRQINIHISILVLGLLAWSAVTVWGSYLSAQQVDYWRAQASNHVLKMKVKYLLTQLDQSRRFLDEVKSVESELREMLGYQNRAALIRQAPTASGAAPAAGGPTSGDQLDLTRALLGADRDLSWKTLTEMAGLMRNETKERLSSYDDLSNWIEVQRRRFRATPQGWPVKGRLSSRFGRRASPFTGEPEYHPGIDIPGPTGTPIRATADGVVRLASWRSGYGNLVVLQHDFGYSTRFGHNSRLLVKVGDRVKRGQVIALMGSTGKSSGPHCHYEVWKNNQRQNPFAYLREDGHHALVSAKRASSN